MTAPTLLVEPTDLDRDRFRVEGEAYQHLFRAARLATGAAVRVVDGAGRARRGEVARVGRRCAELLLLEPAPPLEPALELELLVAPPRPSRASWLVEKGTELGVRAFRFLECERGARPLDQAGLERLRRVARAAVEQCGRSRLPELDGPHDLDRLLERRGEGAAFVLDPGAASGPPRLTATAGGRAMLAVGPEGGFTAAELERAAQRGGLPVRLLAPVLRVETAALAGAAWLLLQGQPAFDSGADPG